MTNALADEIYDELNADPLWNGDVLVDDRTKYSIGLRIKWAQEIGLPYLVVAGKQVRNYLLKLLEENFSARI